MSESAAVGRVDVARLRELRELVIRADSYLSLLWHRHVPDERKDTELRLDVERTIADLRRCYERGDLSESALTKALVPTPQPQDVEKEATNGEVRSVR